jgi:hypothetical protein
VGEVEHALHLAHLGHLAGPVGEIDSFFGGNGGVAMTQHRAATALRTAALPRPDGNLTTTGRPC